VPELFAYIRTLIDEHPSRMGQWFFTGSQEAPLMQGVSESMAGRAAILHLLPLSAAETDRVGLLLGGFPEVIARPRTRALWFSSYIQTYLERDVRAIVNVRDLATFRRFLALLASRHGQVLNRSDLASPLGVSVPTVSDWLHVLEITGQIMLVPPYFENFGKRLIKSPKIYLMDSGVKHLAIVDAQGRPVGILSADSFMTLDALSPLALRRSLESARDLDEVVEVADRLPGVFLGLIDARLEASVVTRVLTTMHDAAVSRLLELAIWRIVIRDPVHRGERHAQPGRDGHATRAPL
jgi:hypothetical protein